MKKETLIAVWAVAGVAALILRALGTLTPIAVEALTRYELAPVQWALLVGWVAFNAWAEGVVGFHQKFSPRVVARALELGRHPSVVRVLLGAPYSIGFFGAPRRVMITSWTLLAAIVALVLSVDYLEQPWRGILDSGVVAGLGIGLLSLLYCFVRAIGGRGDG